MKFSESEVFLLHAVVIELDRITRDEILVGFETTYNEFLVLMAVGELTESGGPDANVSSTRPTHRSVEAYLNVSKSLVSQRVRSLTERSLLLQIRNPANRREYFLELSRSGRTELEAISERLMESASTLMRVLGDGRDQFRRSLLRMLPVLVSGPLGSTGTSGT